MLRREQKIRNIVLFTLFSLVFIGVGYAIINSTLNINGKLQINNLKFDVHFEDIQASPESTVEATELKINELTNVKLNVNLKKPGDVYKFTVKVVNKGNTNAVLSNLELSGLTGEQTGTVSSTIKYSDEIDVQESDKLTPNQEKTIVVTIKSDIDISNDQLPTADENLTLNLSMDYVQEEE